MKKYLILLFLNQQSFSAPFPAPLSPSSFVLYFGANGTGSVDNIDYLLLANRSSLAGYGWQNNAAVVNYTHGESNLYTAAKALSIFSPTLPVFVYRHFQMSWSLFDIQRILDNDPKNAQFFLHDNDNTPNSIECRQGIPGGSTSPLFAFVNTSAGDIWINKVIKEVVTESIISAVFFDETDWSLCGYSFNKDGCVNISNTFRIQDLLAKLPVIRNTAISLLKANKWPIFSSKNLLNASWKGLPITAQRPCLIPHDAYFNILKGLDYGRFYEFWMGRGKDEDAATIENVLLEGAEGVGLIARAGADIHSQCSTTCEEGSVSTTSLSYALAAFLIARTSPWSYFGVSSGWYSPCWCWHDEYDLASNCGSPIEHPIRTSIYSWIRKYENCTVFVNTSSGEGSFR